MKSLWILPLLAVLAGCNWVNNVSGLSKEAHKALGAACRQTGRSLEECFRRNPDADTAAIYAGWREMNEYMAKNKLETMEPPTDSAAGHADSSSPKAAASTPAEGKSSRTESNDATAPPPLTSEEADKAAKSDPQVAAVLAAIRKNGGGEKPKSKPSSGGEPDQKRLLNIIQQLNGNKPAADGDAPADNANPG
ncbi:hypothetical protein DLM_0810 [Aquitalea magnusonii]|uniref:Lipoprotein n=1 Tax=Aquitalea magnusonii TaxID=332411 RepID=A0A3G9GFQ3_9NEIS|nr:hypothetical protein [Aquitalea magnusonii]BBF84457.1 hypothetical protein DLM_0810 [Aquitalea magnusonii]